MSARDIDLFTRKPLVGGILATTVTIAVFAKTFVPFYRMGSTAIFVGASLVGATLIAVNWRRILERVGPTRNFLVIAALLYALVTANYFFFSSKQVPLTHLLGLL